MKALGFFDPSFTEADLHHCFRSGVAELIFSHLGLSRFGNLSTAQFCDFSLRAHQAQIRVVLEWDILMSESHFQRAKLIFDSLLKMKSSGEAWFDAVRVQDPGAAHYVREHCDLPIQFNLETGNHNFEAIQGWVELLKPRLERVILSIEIPGVVLEKMIQKLPVAVEILGLGPVLLLYTPRHLLSIEKNDLAWVENDEQAELHSLHAIASSEESQHKGFRIYENLHGTFVIHHKDYCLLDKIDELKKMGLQYFRVDARLNKPAQHSIHQTSGAFATLLKVQTMMSDFDLNTAENWIQTYEHKVTHCFYRANATDVLFKKLKNMHAQRKDEAYVGEVFEVSKNRYTVMQVSHHLSTLKKGTLCRFVNTEGKETEYSIESLKNLEGENIQHAEAGEWVILPYVKGVTVRTQVYK